MAAADDLKPETPTPPPSPSTAVTSAPPAPAPAPAPAETPAPPKPAKARMSPEDHAKIVDRLDTVLVALVLLFAFLAASFPVRNSDFWQHLATGRLIARGEYEVGRDPFTFTAEGVRWVNHSWLYDLVLYLIHGVGERGGAALIVLKGLAVAALAGVLLVLSRNPGQRWLIAGACTAVAMLAMGPRLLFQPVVLSYLFLGLTLLVVRWPHLRPPPENPKAPRSYGAFWLLPGLFALWVNCDQWFFLGPVAAGLYWLGEYLQDALSTERRRPRDPAELRTLGYAVLAGVAACLLNPHHVFAFTLPAQLGVGDAAAAVKNDPQLKLLFVSPLDGAWWTPTQGLSAPGIAYVVLLAAGVVSFTLAYNTLRWHRVLLFVAFGLLSIYHARAIPFFAVVAGPITALNFLDYLSATFGGEVEPDRLRERWTLGRAAALAAALALVVCTVPGWTQARPYETRHVGWQLAPDASLERTCKQIARWRADGFLAKDARWFNVSPEVVNYMAWYCPGERGFFDLRLALFDGSAQDYEDARADLLGKKAQSQAQPDQPQVLTSGAWREIFAKHKIDYAIIYTSDTYALQPALVIQLRKPDTWTLCRLDGHTLVSGWNKDAEARRRNEPLKLDVDARAFGPKAERAPRWRPERAGVRFEWYMALWQAPPPRQPEVDDAAMYHFYLDFQKQLWQEREIARGRRVQRVLPVLAAAGPGALAALTDPRSPLFNKDFAPEPTPSPAPLYLALRDLRRGLRANPDDARAYLELGKVYFDLFWQYAAEWRAAGGAGFHHVAVVRLTQTAWALNKAIQLDPDLEEAYHYLAEWCRLGREQRVPTLIDGSIGGGIAYLDVELRLRREQLRIARENAGRAAARVAEAESSEVQEQLARRAEDSVKALEQVVDKLNDQVTQQQNQLEVQAANKSVVERARLALQLGLADEALSVLQKASDKDKYVGEGNKSYPLGAVLQAKILLSLGQIEDVRRQVVEPDQDLGWGILPEYGVPCRQWFRLLVAAASGDYDEADDALAAMNEPTLRGEDKIEAVQRCALLRYPLAGLNVFERVNEYALVYLTAETNFAALRGWLALEAGDTAAARKHAQAVRDVAVRRGRLLAPFAAVGVTFPAERAKYIAPLAGPGGRPLLRSAQLAEWEVYLLDRAPANGP
jgi:hypothetical protein